MDDRELLRASVERSSEQAFAELVERHVNMVYATALRCNFSVSWLYKRLS